MPRRPRPLLTRLALALTLVGAATTTSLPLRWPPTGGALTPDPAYAACGVGGGGFEGTQYSAPQYYYGISAQISTDNPSTCSDGNKYFVKIVGTGGTICSGQSGTYSYMGWLINDTTSPHVFDEANGYSGYCDFGPLVFGSVSGTNTYVVNISNGTPTKCQYSAIHSYYLNGVLVDYECVDFSNGVYVQVGANAGEDGDNIASTGGVAFGYTQYCAGTAGCTPSTDFTPTAQNALSPAFNYGQYKQTTSNNGFVVCDTRATPNPCS